jgi:putative endopeptidase
MRKLFLSFTFVALPLAAALGLAQPARPAAPASSASGLDLQAIDRSADPCTDFYQFACGAWIKNNPVPADRPRWSRFDEVSERNSEILRRALDRAAAAPAGASQKIGDYYASCMDESAINKLGTAPLAPTLKQIAALQNAAALPALVADLHKLGVTAFFAFGAEADFKDATSVIATMDQGGLGLPDRDYYFRADARSTEIRKQYVEHVANMMALTGSDRARASAEADAVMRLETALAKAALDVVARRNPENIYHKMTPAELQALTPGFDWGAYFKAAGTPPIAAVNVMEPEFFKAVGQTATATPIGDIRTYLRWQAVRASAFLLAEPLAAENFRFYSTVLQGVTEQRPRWRRCVQYTDSDLGEELGQVFVKEAFGERAKADMLEMVKQLETSLERDIQTLPWMTDATKKEAIGKLHAITNKIGYPDRWRDYGALRIVRGDALGNSQRANAFEFQRQMNRIGKPVDKSEWSMTPPTVNAYYHPLQNNINFPAGILQPPFYGATADAAVNYGGAGAVIGHELTHGFDDQGRQFAANGNLHDWWTPVDAKAFEERAACFVDQYAGYTAIEDVKLNGKLTLGENSADNGGLRIALLAYLASPQGRDAKTLDGFTPEQRVFLGWGQIWCENRTPEFARMHAQTNPHSPGRYRANGVVANMPEFQKAFSCKPDAPMVRATQCRVW